MPMHRPSRSPYAAFSFVEVLVVTVILTFFFALAVNQLRRARIARNEELALNSIRVIGKACHFYYVVNGRYPADLVTLGPSVSNPPYIDSMLTENPMSQQGYALTYRVVGGGAGFTLLGNPLTHKITGRRHFYTDQEFTVHETSQNRNATSADPSMS